ncbi:MAG: hypothetical protein IPG25_00265 [Proteobacteria bacterium]|nr:hypothetical protein [Pseudomonadota bacterium]
MHSLLLCGLLASALCRAELVIDGVLAEPEWADAAVFDQFRQVDPETQAVSEYPTIARVLATPAGLAVGIKAYLPRELRTYGRSPRDSTNMDADVMRVVVDFDGSGRGAYDFSLSLSDSVRDGAIVNQNQYSTDWDGAWLHAVSEDDEAWYGEYLIPWSVAPSARQSGDTKTIGIWLVRYIKSQGRGFAYPSIPPSRPTFVADFHRLEVARYSAAAVNWAPYASYTVDRLAASSKGRAGLDLQWKGEAGSQLIATLNPDFGQVESDDLVVNFSAIETFFSEKRPFFTENQQLFDLRTSLDGRLVNTRRIGGAPDLGEGGSTDILAAAKFTSLAGDFEYGAFAAVEADPSNEVEGRSYFAARALYRGERVSLGYLGTLTDRPALARRASVNVLDSDWVLGNGVRLQGMALASLIDAPGADDGAGAFAILSYDRGGRFSSESSLSWFDRHLEINDLGYLQRRNLQRMRSIGKIISRDFPADSSRAVTTTSLEADVRRSDTGTWLQSRVTAEYAIRYRTPEALSAYATLHTQGVDDLITRGAGPVKLPNLLEVGVDYQRQFRAGVRLTLAASAFEDGVRDKLSQFYQVGAKVVITPNLSTDLSIDYVTSPDWLVFLPETDQLVSFGRRSAVLRAALNWYPGRRHELRTRLQFIGLEAFDGVDFERNRVGDLAHLSCAGPIPGRRIWFAVALPFRVQAVVRIVRGV